MNIFFYGIIIVAVVLWLGYRYHPWFLHHEGEKRFRKKVLFSRSALEDWMRNNPAKKLSNADARDLLRQYLRDYAEYLNFAGVPRKEGILKLEEDCFNDTHWRKLCGILNGPEMRTRELPPLSFPVLRRKKDEYHGQYDKILV